MAMSALSREFVKRGSELASATVPAILAFTLLISYCPRELAVPGGAEEEVSRGGDGRQAVGGWPGGRVPGASL
jgi:hypothetical protein